MIGSLNLGLRYLEVPKVACCAIKLALLEADGVLCRPQEVHDARHWERIRDWSPNATFAFVRDPMTRLESAYREKLRTGKAQIIDPKRCKLGPEASFHDWVLWVTDQDPANCNWHWRPQARILAGQTWDFLGKFEHLDEDWGRLREAHPGLPALKVINPSPRPLAPCEWDWATFDRAAKFYRADLEQFGYPGWRNL